MMGVSKYVLDRLEKRKSAYKDLLNQLVEQVFNKFTEDLNDAWSDGCANERDKCKVHYCTTATQTSSEDQSEMAYLNLIGSLFSQQQQQSSPLHSNEDSSLHSSSNIINSADDVREVCDDDDEVVENPLENMRIDEGEESWEVMDNEDNFKEKEINSQKPQVNNPDLLGMYGQKPQVNNPDLLGVYGQKPQVNNPDLLGMYGQKPQVNNPDLLGVYGQKPQVNNPNLLGVYGQKPKVNNPNLLGVYGQKPQVNNPSLSVMNGQMDGDMREDDQHLGNDEEELVLDDQVGDDEDSEDGVDQLIELVNGQLRDDEENDEEYDDDWVEVDEMDKDSLSFDFSAPPRDSIHLMESIESISNGMFTKNSFGSMHSQPQPQLSAQSTNEEYEITLHSNEDSSLHSSPTQSQPSSQHQNIIQHEEQVSDTEIMPNSNQISLFQPSSSQQSYQECNLDEVDDDDGEYSEDNWDDEVESIVRPALRIVDKVVEESGEAMGNDQNEVQGKEHEKDTILSRQSSINNSADYGKEVCDEVFEGPLNLCKKYDNMLQDRHNLAINILNGDIVMPENSSTGKQICPYCGKFKETSDLNRHILKHTNAKSKSLPKLNCPYCGKTLRGQQALTRHIRIHTGAQDCDLCDSAFQTVQTNQNLQRHILTNTGERPFKWPHKQSTKQSLRELRICKYCGKGFKSCLLDRHIRMHTGERPYKCPKCAQAFNQNSHLQRHLMSQHKLGKLACTYCAKTFQSPSDLKNHVRTHTVQKPFLCTWKDCGKSFSDKYYLKKHRCIHMGEKPFKCPWKDCNKAYTHSCQRIVHFKAHTDNKPFKCPWEDCREEFVGIRGFPVHVEHHHTGERPVKRMRSEVVEGKRDERRIMKNPVQRNELSNSQPFGNVEGLLLVNGQIDNNTDMNDQQIDQQDSEDDRVDQLNGLLEVQRENIDGAVAQAQIIFPDINEISRFDLSHPPLYSGERPTQCPRCFEIFDQYEDMRRHFKNYHNGRFLYVCQYCSQTFWEVDHLRVHIGKHTGVKPFKCEWNNCGKSFNQKSYLKRHFKAHTKE